MSIIDIEGGLMLDGEINKKPKMILKIKKPSRKALLTSIQNRSHWLGTGTHLGKRTQNR